MCGDGDIPLIAERGYSIEFSDTDQASPSELLTRATCFQRGGFILSPLQSRLRAAGLVEFGPNQPPTAENLLALETTTRKLLQNLPAAVAREPTSDWLGGRPTLPDYLPVISRSSVKSNVVYAFGHQHVGFTLAGITGKIVADLAEKKEHELDFSLQPYAVQRFL
jgi:D-amino-acid dehydrogenase